MDNGLATMIWLSCGMLGTMIACFKKVIRWEPEHMSKAAFASLLGPIWLMVCLITWLEIELKYKDRKVIKNKVKIELVNRFEMMDI